MESISNIDLDDYKIIKSLGKGTFGEVFLVENKKTLKKYAAKVSFIKSEVSSYIKEIMSLSITDDPNILKFYGYSPINFSKDPYPTLILDYMPNGSLEEFLEKLRQNSTQFTGTQKYIILIGIAYGMKYLHSKGLIHRDLKPLNILLDEKYYPKICDFGISFFSDINISNIHMEDTVGTPLYTAPEVFDDDQYTYKVDVYSYALIAYELLTNVKPFTEYKTKYKLFKATSNGVRPDLTIIKDKRIQDFLSKCWDPNPEKRPSFEVIYREILEEYFIDYFTADKDVVFKFILENDSKVKNYVEKELSKNRKEIESILLHGLKLYEGDGVPQNKKEAAQLYKKAADKGSELGMCSYANMLNFGDGIPVDHEEAAKYYKLAADKGYNIGIRSYGELLIAGKGITQNKKEAFQYFKLAAEKGDVQSMRYCGNMLMLGKDIEKNESDAARYYKMAADHGDTESMIKYGMITSNKEESECYYEIASYQDNEKAMINISKSLMDGENVNLTETLKFMKIAADRGSVPAMGRYGALIIHGKIEDKYDEAMKYIKMAADKGNIHSMTLYANQKLNGNICEVDKKEAAEYFKNAADLGQTLAMFYYSQMLLNGDGIELDKIEAARYCKMAADRGYTRAIISYGLMCSNGDGVDQNRNEAMKYFKIAADSGDKYAAFLYKYELFQHYQDQKKVKSDDIIDNKKKSDDLIDEKNKSNIKKVKKKKSAINHVIKDCNTKKTTKSSKRKYLLVVLIVIIICICCFYR